MNQFFSDIFPIILLVIMVTATVGWLFFSDKIVSLFLSKEEKQKSWIWSSDADRR